MIVPFDSCRVVGGTRPANGRAPFARGAIVVGRADVPGRFLWVRGFGETEVEGDDLDEEEWKGLLLSGQAMRLRTLVIPRRYAALWVFRRVFEDRDRAIAQLTRAGALLHSEEVSTGGPIAAIVREDLGDPIRDYLALGYFARARQLVRKEDWPRVLPLANLAFVLSRGLVAERVALLALALNRWGSRAAGEGLLDVATRSRGEVFGQAVSREMARIAREEGVA